jgi:hypothetical protein
MPSKARPAAAAVRGQSHGHDHRAGRRQRLGGRAGCWILSPGELHQRVPLILGCKTEVERIERYHLEHDQGLDRIYSSPLFKERSLFIKAIRNSR